MNVAKAIRTLHAHEQEYALYTVFQDDKDMINCIHHSKGVKKGMYIHEVALFSYGTLKVVQKEPKKRL